MKYYEYLVFKEILWIRLDFKEILWIRLVLVSARQLIKPSSSLAHSTSDFCGSTSCLHSDAQEIRRIPTGAGHGYRPSAVPQELFGLSHCHASVLGQRSHSCGPRRSPRARRCYCVRRARSTYGAAEVRMTPRPAGKDVDPRRGRTPHIFRFPRASGAASPCSDPSPPSAALADPACHCGLPPRAPGPIGPGVLLAVALANGWSPCRSSLACRSVTSPTAAHNIVQS